MDKRLADVRSVEELCALYNEGVKVKYVFFWGHKHQKIIGSSCLSNWYPCKFLHDGVEYKTTEHYMMAQKALLFKDEEYYQKIISCRTPGEAKKLGRMVRGFDQEVWIKHRFQIVVDGNYAKFSQNSDFGEYLKKTGQKVLVEASPRDRIWGIGMSAQNEKSLNPNSWLGLNLLGFVLMEVRAKL